jgi:hypothetical protein
MESLDKITLELLINKNQYNKYLVKEDPKKYELHKKYLESIKKYKYKILNITKKFIEDPEFSLNLEMNEMFSIFFKTFIRYFDMQEVEIQNFYNIDTKKEDEDIMFGKIDEVENESESEECDEKSDEECDEKSDDQKKKNDFKLDEALMFNKTMNSFWGKNIKKI